ncbi:methionine--tRNA ligase subunit beta [Candidatus Micrarchaeota archaeon]|nr:methionine--tRNA ligase subunit beta [Candidatus Micrarchaeota archaeon]
MDSVKYEDFSKLEIRVGQILSAERIQGADKLLKLSVDTGEEAPRTLVAGLALRYAPEDLAGKKIVVLCNLEPKTMKGVQSEGMLLAAGETHESIQLLVPDGDAPIGTRIY